MTDHTDPSDERPAASVPPSRRSLRAERAAASHRSARGGAAAGRRALRPGRRRRLRPVQGLVVVGAVGALVATLSIPAFAATRSAGHPRTVEQRAAGHAQSLVVSSAATPAAVSRAGYTATTPAEIAKKKADEAAARARRAAAAVPPAVSAVPIVDAGGGIRWPLAHIDRIGEGFHARGGEHQGVDLIDPAGTPILAATSGTVSVSSESYYGYGVAVAVDTVIGGQKITTLYGHMTYGSRRVTVGQHVQAGQVIGAVGDTGHSFGSHLHFEVHRNGVAVDPLAWLRANAG